MGWSQSYHVESVTDFLARECGINIDEMVRRAANKAGVGIGSRAKFDLDPDGIYPCPNGARITLTDGRVFEHRLVRSQNGDDWGVDSYEFHRIDLPNPVPLRLQADGTEWPDDDADDSTPDGA